MLDIFCPKCQKLILDQAVCSACGWQRPVEDEGVGAVVWGADLGTRLSKPHCYPVVAAGRYCLGTEDGTLIALDVASGEVAWERPLGEGQMAHALASDGERLFVGCEDVRSIPEQGKALLALDVRTGADLWQFPVAAHSLSAAAVAGGVVYFTTSDSRLYAVDGTTGEQRWVAAHAVAWGPAAPAVGQGVVCAGGRGGTLVGYAAADGRELWRYAASGWFAALPVVSGEAVYASCWDDHLYVLDMRTGRLLWRFRGERDKGLTTPPAVAEGQVFVGSRVHRQTERGMEPGYAMLALRTEDRTETWRFYTNRHVFTPPMVSQGMVFFGSDDGYFYAVDAASGQERWRIQVKSRAVTYPQVADDLVIFGGRDGLVYAVRWRVSAEAPDPRIFEQQGMLAEAAAAYALQGDLGRAAALYAQMGKCQQAAQLYEHGGQPEPAAPLWEACGNLNRARDLYRQAGDRTNLVRLLVQTGEPLQAARLCEEMGKLEEAAQLYEEGGDRMKAAELYKRVGKIGRSRQIWASLGKWEKEVDALVDEGDLAGAARILEQHGQLARAADLYAEAGEFERALELEAALGRWESVAELAEQVAAYEWMARAHKELGHPQRAAEAYLKAAQQAQETSPLNEAHIAALYEQAARLYETIFDEERAVACQRMVRRYRRLPEVEVQIVAEGGFVECEYNVLNLEVSNRGYGIARNIAIQMQGRFDVEGDCCIRGLPPQRSKPLEISVRPQKGHYGPKVPLDIIVTYEDERGVRYDFRRHATVRVDQEGGLLARLTGGATPLQISINELELYQAGAKKVEGTEVHPGGQVGDRVEIHRGEGGGLTLESGPTGERVKVRRGKKLVRRCPVCNLPVEDPEQRYCSDCGAPLDEQMDTRR